MISNQAPSVSEGAIIAYKEQDINLFHNLMNKKTSSFLKIAMGHEESYINEIIDMLRYIFTFEKIEDLLDKYEFLQTKEK